MRKLPRIFQRSGRGGFYFELHAGGERKTVRCGDTREQAEDAVRTAAGLRNAGHDLEAILDAILPNRRTAQPKTERLTFRQAVPKYLKTAERRMRPVTFAKREGMLARIVRAEWTARRLDAIKPATIHRWAEGRREGGAGACCVNRDLNALGCVFKWAQSLGIVETNPARSPMVRRDREPVRDTWFSADEAEYLFRVADEHVPGFGDVLRFLFWTGIRRGELAQLQWRDIDLRKGLVNVRSEVAKNGKARQFDLTPDALALVRRLPTRFQGGRVILRPDGGHFNDDAYCNRMKRLREFATGDEIPEHKRGSAIRCHALRHSHITLLAAAGVSLTLVGQSVGQSSVWMVERYAHHTPQGRRAVADAGAVVFTPTTKPARAIN